MLLNHASIRFRLTFMAGVLTTLMLVMSMGGLYFNHQQAEVIRDLHQEDIVILKRITDVSRLYAVNVVDTAHKARNGNLNYEQALLDLKVYEDRIAREWQYYSDSVAAQNSRIGHQQLEMLEPLKQQADRLVGELHTILIAGNVQALVVFTTEALYQTIDPLTQLLTEFASERMNDAEHDAAEALETYEQTRFFFLTVLVIALALAIGLSSLVTQSITRPLHTLVNHMRTLKSGRMADISRNQKGEFGFVMRELAELQEIRLKMEQERSAVQSKLQRFSDVLIALYKRTGSGQDYNARIKETLAKATMALEVNRSSVWELSDDGKTLLCQHMYERSAGLFTRGQTLSLEEAPQYRSALHNHRVMTISNVNEDERIAPLIDYYFAPKHIQARMDAVIITDNLVQGIVCFEHCFSPRQWLPEESVFAGAIADLIQSEFAAKLLIESKDRAQAIIDNTVDAIITINEFGVIQSFNHSAEDIFQYPEAEVLGQNVKMLMPESFAREHDQYLRNYLDSGEAHIIGIGREVSAVRKNGDVFPADLAVSRISHRDKIVFVGMIRDISERKRNEQLKKDFISTMNHELRTPLTSISGSLALIASGTMGVVPEKAVELLNIARNNVNRLGRLINELLDMDKILSGKMTFTLSVCDVQVLVGRTVKDIESQIGQKKLTTEIQAPQDTLRIRVDAERLSQILLNFLSNAIKFAPASSMLRINLSREDANIRISVSDEGPGIPDSFHTQLFQKFAQVDSSDTKSKGGQNWLFTRTQRRGLLLR
ncbi:MAG: PAS domain S-box protein [Hahellaceae bacterium]|nr:PAS domain S-box protein [Hahellaceae bacterium]